MGCEYVYISQIDKAVYLLEEPPLPIATGEHSFDHGSSTAAAHAGKPQETKLWHRGAVGARRIPPSSDAFLPSCLPSLPPLQAFSPSWPSRWWWELKLPSWPAENEPERQKRDCSCTICCTVHSIHSCTLLNTVAVLPVRRRYSSFIPRKSWYFANRGLCVRDVYYYCCYLIKSGYRC